MDPLYTADALRALDQRLAHHLALPAGGLMERAGTRLFAQARSAWPTAHRWVVAVGPGNNGGDGLVLARQAREAGYSVTVLSASDRPPEWRGDAAIAAERWRAAGGEVRTFDPEVVSGAELLVDALFGTGLTRAVRGVWAELVEALNAHSAPVLAADIPSGLHADTGTRLGATVRADRTVTFIAPTVGLFTGAGPECVGLLRHEDLGAPPAVFAGLKPVAYRERATPGAPSPLPRRRRTAHKGVQGHVLVIGGGEGMPGAVRLAGEAALRGGAGRVSAAVHPRSVPAVGSGPPELMVHGVRGTRALRGLLDRVDVLAVGPGLGQSRWATALWEIALDAGLPMVLDADGLNRLAARPQTARHTWILTPHPGEAGRLLRTNTGAVEADRIAATRRLQRRFGGVVVLKGAGTLIGEASETLQLCDRGNPGMASGGMGDALTGLIAALLAQGLPLPEAAWRGVCYHSAAGDRAAASQGEHGLLARDLIAALPAVLNGHAPPEVNQAGITP